MISGVLIPLEGALRRLTGALKYGTVEDSGQPRRGGVHGGATQASPRPQIRGGQWSRRGCLRPQYAKTVRR